MINNSIISTKWTITSYLNSLITKKKDHSIWYWKSRSLVGTGI